MFPSDQKHTNKKGRDSAANVIKKKESMTNRSWCGNPQTNRKRPLTPSRKLWWVPQGSACSPAFLKETKKLQEGLETRNRVCKRNGYSWHWTEVAALSQTPACFGTLVVQVSFLLCDLVWLVFLYQDPDPHPPLPKSWGNKCDHLASFFFSFK